MRHSDGIRLLASLTAAPPFVSAKVHRRALRDAGNRHWYEPLSRARSIMPSERGTPPDIVQSTPVPAHVMRSNTLRRLKPLPYVSSRSDFIINLPT
jgi:hypothetical protein